MKNRKKNALATVAIEITRTNLVMVRADSPDKNDVRQLRSRVIKWRDKSRKLFSEIGMREFAVAFETLVNKEKLNGRKIRLVLSGDYCVTRVVAGSIERVKHELELLTERSKHYIALGAGEKTTTTHIRHIDARNQHALCVVANRRNLEIILQTANNAGVIVELVEPSMVALSRYLGHIQKDTQNPALILNLSQFDTQIGISHQGHLILDYHPGGNRNDEDVVELITGHLERLQRYCDRFYRFTQGKLKQIYLCGCDEIVSAAAEKYRNYAGRLEISILSADSLDAGWKLQEKETSYQCMAALGAALITNINDRDQFGPNLLNSLHSEEKIHLPTELLKTCWPLVASLLLAIGVFGLHLWEKNQLDQLTVQLDHIQTRESQARLIEMNITSANKKIEHLDKVKNELVNPHWNQLLINIGGSLPEGVWLKKIDSASDAKVKIIGTSFSEEAIFETTKLLLNIPQFTRVALEGTRSGQYQGVVVYDFQLICDYQIPNETNYEEKVK